MEQASAFHDDDLLDSARVLFCGRPLPIDLYLGLQLFRKCRKVVLRKI